MTLDRVDWACNSDRVADLYLFGRVGSELAELGFESAELTELQPESAESAVADTHKNADSKITCLCFIFKIFLILTIT